MEGAVAKRKVLSSGLTVSQKVFVRSRNGNASKIVREHYLRDDIPCFSQACTQCSELYQSDNGTVISAVLSESPSSLQSSNIGRHYVLLDTNVVLGAIDLLESDSVFFDVVIPQTVLNEVRNKSLPIYTRLRALCKSDDKRIAVFHNEFSSSTFVSRRSAETINDYNDRLIRTTASFYSDHLKSTGIKMIYITNDKNNLELALAESLDAMSLEAYIGLLPNSQELLDLLPTLRTDFSRSGTKLKFPDYYSTSRLLGGIKNGTLYQGIINISSYNSLEGSISVSSLPKPLLILGSENLNRSFSGDTVVIEMLPRDKWKKPSNDIVDEETLGSSENADNDDPESVISDRERRLLTQEAVKAQTSGNDDDRVFPTGKVVGISKRSWRSYVGQISARSVDKTQSSNATRSVFVILMDRSLPKVRIRTGRAKDLVGKRIVVSVDSWPANMSHPEGHYVRTLGDVEDKDAEQEALLLEHDVEYRPFSKNVLECLPKEGHDWKVPEDLNNGDPQLAKRKDLRHKLICSIDPPGCVDIDDALHAEKLPNGNFEVGVHIADVSHFVKANTAIDQEGASRGTSVYLVDKRIDMLPMLLGTDLCSLKPYVDRFAFSVLWELDQDANIVNVSFTKSIIKSREAFAYEQAQNRIDDESQKDDLTKGMRYLLALSKKLKQKRMDAGALNLSSPEVKVHMDSETSDPGEVEIKKLLDTNSLVEEFMLLANISVARKIFDAFPQVAMLRRHASPPQANFEQLNEMLRVRKNMAVSLESSKALADSLDRCVDPNDAYFNTLIRIMATRCMMSAEYFASGNYSYNDFRHYGLAVDIYTHFTSPIRRYCDVVAHRQLAAAINYEPLSIIHRDKTKMDLVVKNINKRHRNAQFAGRASIEYYVGQVMKNAESLEEGYVIKVFSNGFVVLVPKFGVESLIKLNTLTQSGAAKFDEENFKLTFTTEAGEEREIAVFDRIKVQVKSVLDEMTSKRKTQLVLV